MMEKRKIVVLTGAGVSAESGLSTFRDEGGLWAQHRIEDVATPEAWTKDPGRVLDFYNQRRRQLDEITPNRAHRYLKELEEDWSIHIITQNVDNLHESAGSRHVLHLHGELTKVRSTRDAGYIQDIGHADLNLGDVCPSGFQLRPHIVWFGEEVPALEKAAEICKGADVLLIIGTSLNVYPAAGLIHAIQPDTPIIIIDPAPEMLRYKDAGIHVISSPAGKGEVELKRRLSEIFGQ